MMRDGDRTHQWDSTVFERNNSIDARHLSGSGIVLLVRAGPELEENFQPLGGREAPVELQVGLFGFLVRSELGNHRFDHFGSL